VLLPDAWVVMKMRSCKEEEEEEEVLDQIKAKAMNEVM